MSCSQESVTFLDVEDHTTESGNLSCDLFRKPIADNSILHFSSFHPKPLLNSIPTGQYLHLWRICSNQTDFDKQASDLRCRLRSRGYSKKSKAYNRASGISRQQLLYQNKPKDTSQNTTRFITRYTTQHLEINKLLRRHWHLLQADPWITSNISEAHQVTFRKAQSLPDGPVHSHHSNTATPHCDRLGTFRCKHCDICPYIHECARFWHPNGRFFIARHFVDCNTASVVYLFSCECGCFYVGKTRRPLCKQLQEHVYAISICDLSVPLGRHAAKFHSYKTFRFSFVALGRIHTHTGRRLG